jgi:response regulator RpfG family c-di-GMP phosphodiesterase
MDKRTDTSTWLLWDTQVSYGEGCNARTLSNQHIVNSPYSVLIVAAENELRLALRTWLMKRRFDVQEASNLDEAIAAIFNVPDTSAIICDERLPDGGALNLLCWLREQLFPALFLMITGLPPRIQFPHRSLKSSKFLSQAEVGGCS